MTNDELLNRPEVKVRRFEGLLVQLHEVRGKVKAYRNVLDMITTALESQQTPALAALQADVSAAMVGVLQEGQQITDALDRILPGFVQSLLDEPPEDTE